MERRKLGTDDIGKINMLSLKTPGKEKHRFRMNVRKLMDQYNLTDRLIIALLDLNYAERAWQNKA